MPIYEYACSRCGNRFEHLARRLSEAAPKCPQCGAAGPVKQFSVFSAGKSAGADADFCGSGECPSAGSCASETCPLND